jgi:hypothetical protein
MPGMNDTPGKVVFNYENVFSSFRNYFNYGSTVPIKFPELLSIRIISLESTNPSPFISVTTYPVTNVETSLSAGNWTNYPLIYITCINENLPSDVSWQPVK